MTRRAASDKTFGGAAPDVRRGLPSGLRFTTTPTQTVDVTRGQIISGVNFGVRFNNTGGPRTPDSFWKTRGGDSHDGSHDGHDADRSLVNDVVR